MQANEASRRLKPRSRFPLSTKVTELPASGCPSDFETIAPGKGTLSFQEIEIMGDDGLIEPQCFYLSLGGSFSQADNIDNRFGTESGEGISVAARSPLRKGSMSVNVAGCSLA